MILDKVSERFIAESPLVVMFRVLLEQSLSAQAVVQLFEKNAQQRYQKECLFSSIVSLVGGVVCSMAKSVHSAYQSTVKQVGVMLSAVYQKLNGIKPQAGEVLVQHGATKAALLAQERETKKITVNFS